MTLQFNRPFTNSLLFNLLLVVGGVIVVNSLIFSFEWSTNSAENMVNSPSFAPPGWVIGMVWTLWFIGLAVSRWFIAKIEYSDSKSVRILIDVLIVSCLLYPLYSLAIGSVLGGLIGNIFTIFLASFVFYRVYQVSKKAAWLIFPIIPWVTFATAITLVELGIV